MVAALTGTSSFSAQLEPVVLAKTLGINIKKSPTRRLDHVVGWYRLGGYRTIVALPFGNDGLRTPRTYHAMRRSDKFGALFALGDKRIGLLLLPTLERTILRTYIRWFK